MNTARKLKDITDRGKFELLATAVVCLDSPQYKSLIQLGINEKGETIKAPNDGFSQVPNTNHYLLLQHTTTDRSQLKYKWLSENKNSYGDLLKANQAAQSIKSFNSDATFTVILTSNERLDDELLTEVYKYGTEKNLSIDIFDQTRMTRLLDTRAEGQWLRKEHLGINAEIISRSLLHELSKKSLELYKNEFIFNQSKFIERKELEKLKNFYYQNKSLCHLLGDSGKGKSTIAYNFMLEEVNQGKFAFWIPENIITESTSLTSVLNKLLKELYPSLMNNSTDFLHEFLSKEEKIIITIDDISQLPSPASTVDKVISWSSVKSEVTDRMFTICPLKPWTTIGSSKLQDKNSKPNIVLINSYSNEEAQGAIEYIFDSKNHKLNKYEMKKLSDILNNDPLLIALFNSSLEDTKIIDFQSHAQKTIENYVHSKLSKMSTKKSVHKFKYEKALEELSLFMLENLCFHPSIEDLTDNFSEKTLDTIYELCHFQDIIYLSNQTKKLDFKHDRLREYFLSNEIYKTVSKQDYSKAFLQDPYFADILGISLSKVDNIDIYKEVVAFSPLSLLTAIKHLKENDKKIKQIVKLLIDFIDNLDNSNFPKESVLNQFLMLSLDIDNQNIISFLKKLPASNYKNFALIRNGDINGALSYSSMYREFTPYVNDKWRDEAFEIATEKHRNSLLKSLIYATNQFKEPRQIKALFDTIGYFPFSELTPYTSKLWDQLGNKEECFLHFFWASLRLESSKDFPILKKALNFWKTISDDKDEDRMSPQYRIAEYLRFPLAKGISSNNLETILEWVLKNPDFEGNVAHLLEHYDSPKALEYIVRKCAKITKELEGTDRFSLFHSHISGNWDNRNPRNKKMSTITKTRLFNLWNNSKESEVLQKEAFNLWSVTAEKDDLRLLTKVSHHSIHYNNVIITRAKLGDKSITKEFLDLLETKDHLYPIISKIWSQETKTFLKKRISRDDVPPLSDSSYFIGNAIQQIPSTDAEEILLLLWEKVKDKPRFIHLALYIGSDELLKLADISIKENPNALEHVGAHFGFHTTGLQEKIKERHIHCLMPYLDRLSQIEILDLIRQCEKFNLNKLAENKLIPLLSEEYRHNYPSDELILEELNKLLKDTSWVGRKYRCEEDISNRKSKDSPFSILQTWLETNCSIEAFKIASEIISNKGKRSDIAYLHDAKERLKPLSISIYNEVKFSIMARSLE